MAVCFTVVGVQICLLDIKKFSSPNIWSTAKQAALSKKAFPETIKFRGGRLFCCPWCSDMFIGYTKAFFFQCMSDAKAGGPIEKSNLLGIISALQLWLWAIQKWKNAGVVAYFAVAGVQVCLMVFKFVCEGCSLRYRKNFIRKIWILSFQTPYQTSSCDS